MSVNSKMTAIADEIRELSGTTGTMGLDTMVTNIEDANDEVNSQTELLAQLATALEGKAGGGSVETCTVTFAPAMDIELTDLCYTDENNVIVRGVGTLNVYESTRVTVAKNTLMFLICGLSTLPPAVNGNAEVVYGSNSIKCVAVKGDCSVERDASSGPS